MHLLSLSLSFTSFVIIYMSDPYDILEALYKQHYPSITDLIKLAKGKVKLTQKDIRVWYNNLPNNQIYQKQAKPEYYQIINYFTNSLQIDLMDISAYSSYNKGFKFVFVAIDISSRYAWAFPIRNKTPSTILPHIQTIFSELKALSPEGTFAFSMDDGNEFKGVVSKFFKDNDAIIYVSSRLNNTPNIDNFIQRLWGFFKRYVSTNNNYRFISQLDTFVGLYNNTRHNSTKKKPIHLFHHLTPSEEMFRETPKELFKLNDKVRYKIEYQGIDEKRSLRPNYSSTVHTIVGKEGLRYLLDNNMAFMGYELIKATNSSQLTKVDAIRTTNKALKKGKKNTRKFAKELGLSKTQTLSIKPVKEKRQATPTYKTKQSS